MKSNIRVVVKRKSEIQQSNGAICDTCVYRVSTGE